MKKYLVAAAVIALASGPAQALTTIVNGSFENASSGSSNPPSGGFSTLNAVDNTIAGWTVSQGNVDWINNYWTAQDGTHSIDLGGTLPGDINGWIEQTFNTTAGILYTVTYYISGNPDGGFDPAKRAEVAALLNGDEVARSSIVGIQGASRANMNWFKNTFQFTADGATTTLRFESTENSQFGAAIDNVSISPVPEPATWAMMIGGFGLAGAAMRRRRTMTTVTA